jgi:hypothetical protein
MFIAAITSWRVFVTAVYMPDFLKSCGHSGNFVFGPSCREQSDPGLLVCKFLLCEKIPPTAAGAKKKAAIVLSRRDFFSSESQNRLDDSGLP